MAFDLNDYKQSVIEIADVDILHPATGESLGVKIQVMSPDCNEYRKIALQQQNENIKFIRKNRGKTTAERMNEEAINLAVAITVGWNGLEENGQPIPFTSENVHRVYTQFPFIREQVDEFVADRRNFIKN